jgi:hypothetical protein
MMPWAVDSIKLNLDKLKSVENVNGTKLKLHDASRTSFNPVLVSVYITCRLYASGMVNVDEIQQNVFTTCVGTPLTIHEMGFPTYCVAVMTSEHVSSRTVVKTLWSRNTALSV